MPERTIPEWAAKVGAEVRDRTEQLPVNEPYLVDVTELLRVMLKDNVKSHELGPDRTWMRCRPESSEAKVDSQKALLEEVTLFQEG